MVLRVGTNLRGLRVDAEVTQEALAEDLDITVQHLRGIEGGYRAPSLRLLADACERFGVDVLTLFHEAESVLRAPGRPQRRRST